MIDLDSTETYLQLESNPYHAFAARFCIPNHDRFTTRSEATSRSGFHSKAWGTHELTLSLLEYLLRILQVKKIPFTSYDLASDEEAKRLWKRKAPLGGLLHSIPVLGTDPHAQTSNNYQGFLLVENSQVYDTPIIIFIHADCFSLV